MNKVIESPKNKKTSLNVEEHIACFLCYLFGWISGLVVFLIEKENENVRFHAMQSIVLFGFVSLSGILFSFIPFIGPPLVGIINGTGLVLWIILMVKALRKEKLDLPVVKELAEGWSK